MSRFPEHLRLSVEPSRKLGAGSWELKFITLSIRRALVLTAGNGDRFRSLFRQSKLLQPVLGEPLILRTIRTAMAAGIAEFEIVLGYRADAIRDVIERHAPSDAAVHFSYNPDWHVENRVSALAARDRLSNRPFALLMGITCSNQRPSRACSAHQSGQEKSLSPSIQDPPRRT